MNDKSSNNKSDNRDADIPLKRFEVFQLRALSDEIMNSLCQVKALLEPVGKEDFFERLEIEVLRHYFYAIDTIIDSALNAKDRINKVIDEWEKQGDKNSA